MDAIVKFLTYCYDTFHRNLPSYKLLFVTQSGQKYLLSLEIFCDFPQMKILILFINCEDGL